MKTRVSLLKMTHKCQIFLSYKNHLLQTLSDIHVLTRQMNLWFHSLIAQRNVLNSRKEVN